MIAIIGAGAAGCFAAANLLADTNVDIFIYEKTGKALQKVKASGGGRCNVTNATFDVAELVDKYPRGKQLLKRSLYNFKPEDTIKWFESRGVKLKTEDDGRIFPVSDDSQTIIDCIWQAMMKNKVAVYYHKALTRITKNIDNSFSLYFNDKTIITADKVLIATGGFPKPEQYSWLTGLGHTIQPPVPSLFTFNMPKNPITTLMGISVPDAVVKIPGTKVMEEGPLLITHWGMSGPAILRTSAWAARELHDRNYTFQIQVNWLSSTTEPEVKDHINELRRNSGKQLIYNKNPFNLPKRLWEYQLGHIGIADTLRWGDLPGALQNKLVEVLIKDTYQVSGKTTFKEEFVTCGGVSLNEINPQTMESRIVPGLFFAGEILDVDGITGGFNFQHAWSSAWIAAQNIVK